MHYLAPDDLATIYDITPLYTAGFNGSGETLVIPGQTDLTLSDIATFRSTFGLHGQRSETGAVWDRSGRKQR